MLGENHSLLSEFPEFKELILTLVKDDDSFKSKMKLYDEIDKEIRVLELNGAPINDDEMHTLKVKRSQMKDELHEFLRNH